MSTLRNLARVVPLSVSLLLGACHPVTPFAAPTVSGTTAGSARVLWGRAAIVVRATQALETDVQPYATVSLLDASNNVVATGTTDASGSFSLNPFVSWTPATNTVYVLDLSKGFEGSNDNSSLRLRTLVSWTGSQWKSISGTTAGVAGGSGVLINSGTTAIALIQTLRGLVAANALGTLDPGTGTFLPASSGISAADFATVKGLVGSSLAANFDPVRTISWSSSANAYQTRLSSGGNLLFDLKDTPLTTGTAVPLRTSFGTGFGVSVNAGLYLNQFGSYGGAAGDFINPMGVATDAAGNTYVADFNNNRLDKFDVNGTYLTCFGTAGTGNGQFTQPSAVALDALGNLWVCDFGNNRIQELSPTGVFLRGIGEGITWTSGSPPAVSSGPADSWFNQPHYVNVDRGGNVWVGDYGNNRVQEFSSSGAFELGIGNGTTWTGAAPTPSSGPGASYFSGAKGIAFDGAGNVWVCDALNNRIQEFTSGGAFIRAFGSSGSGNGQFNNPDSIAIDGSGNVWVSEWGNDRVQEFDANANYLGQFGGTGSGNGQLHTARGLAFDPSGNLLVGDWSNHRVCRFAPAAPTLAYSTANHFNGSAGTVEEWVHPTWSGADTTLTYYNCFFECYQTVGSTNDGLSLYKASNASTLTVMYGAHSTSNTLFNVDISSWLPGSDHHVAFTWNASTLSLYLDGRLSYSMASPGTIQAVPSTMYVGNNRNNNSPASAVIGSARVYDYAKTAADIQRDFAMVEQN